MRMWPILALAAACSGTVVQPGGAIDPPDAGAAATAACEVPPMDQIYSGVYPPNPWAPALVAAPCMMQARGWQSALVVSDDPGHLVFTALCDSNCCVDLGRLTVVELPDETRVGHYVLYPAAGRVAPAECTQISQAGKFMCTNMASRLA